ncbi:MAG: hypothetical protein HQ582_12600, partial [Planctomycetes bacterium]|nr:hypothetical protein [Planctomycetota bacterium]
MLCLGVGLIAFLVALYFHPDRFYRRMTGAVLGAWITFGGMPAMEIAGQWDQDTFLRVIVSDAGDWLHIAFAAAFLGSMAITAWVEWNRERDAGGAPAAPDPTGQQLGDVTQQAPGAVQPVQVVAGPQSQIQVTVEAPAATQPTSPGPSVEEPASERYETAALRAVSPDHRIVANSITAAHRFRGRDSELAQLRRAVDGNERVIVVVGMAGQGKSSLLGRWYRLDGQKLSGRRIFWCSPYDVGYRFSQFLADVLLWLLGAEFDLRDYPTTEAQVELLCGVLREEEVLVVLDGAERWLKGWETDADGEDAEPGTDDCRGADPALDNLFADAATWPSGSRLLLSSRALPEVLRDRPYKAVGTETVGGVRTLVGLDPASSVRLLEDAGVRAEGAELRALADQYERHPYALNVLGSLIVREYGGEVGEWNRENPPLSQRHERLGRLLSRAVERAPDPKGLLQQIAVSVRLAPIGMLAELVGDDEAQVRRRLAVLVDWHLLDFDGHNADMHALLRTHLSAAIERDEEHRIAEGIVGWLLRQPIPPQPQTLDDLRPRLWAVDQMLSVDAPNKALPVLSREVDAGRKLSLQSWLSAFGHHTLTVSQHSAMLPGYIRLVDSEGRPELRNDLAAVFNNRGLAYGAQGDLAGAIDDYGHALELYRTLV